MRRSPNTNTGQRDDLLISAPEHRETADDDCGMPEHPIYSNYSKYLWKSHGRNQRMNTLGRKREDTDGNKNIE